MNNFFKALGLTVTIIVGFIVTVALLYLSYILAVGVLIAIMCYLLYELFNTPL
jgi:hypothetical protein